MSATQTGIPSHIEPPIAPDRWNTIVHEIDDRRGTYGIALFILTEAFLFVMLFTAYFYLAKGSWRWLAERPPKLHYVIPMLVVLLASSGVVHWGERQLKHGRHGLARLALVITIMMGLGFLALSAFDYKEHLRVVTPMTNAYGSIFYTITTFHVAHVCLGLLMLIYVLILHRYESGQWPPYRPYHNASTYWHFVDAVWVFVVAFLYLAPNIR
jgi:cytochrome c oxidase subunit III